MLNWLLCKSVISNEPRKSFEGVILTLIQNNVGCLASCAYQNSRNCPVLCRYRGFFCDTGHWEKKLIKSLDGGKLQFKWPESMATHSSQQESWSYTCADREQCRQRVDQFDQQSQKVDRSKKTTQVHAIEAEVCISAMSTELTLKKSTKMRIR